MSKHSERAAELFRQGYNCAQSVFGAFVDEINMDYDTAMKISSAFGGGMGRMREVCGALTGQFMIAGLLYGYSEAVGHDGEPKLRLYELIQDIAAKFKEENGSILCRDLLGEAAGPASYVPSERTPEYYQTRPCEEIVRLAAIQMDELIERKKGE